MYDVQGYKCVSKGVVMYSFQRNKVYELTSSVFYSSLCLFRRNNYTFGVVSLGRLWNILYEKNHYNFASRCCEERQPYFYTKT